MQDPIQPPRYDCDADLVIEMQEMGVGVEEILQLARATFTPTELRSLVAGLRALVPEETPVEAF